MPDTDEDTTAVLDEIGTDTTIHSVLLGSGTGTATNTAFTNDLIEQLVTNQHRQIDRSGTPYTLVLDGIESLVEWDRIDLRSLLAETRKLRLSVVIATQTLSDLPFEARQQFEHHAMTSIVGQISPADAKQLVRRYPTLSSDDFCRLPYYQWWMCEDTPRGPEETQFRSAPPLSNDRTTTSEELE